MEDIREFIRKKRINKREELLVKKFAKDYKSRSLFGSFLKKDNSKDNAYLGLLLLNKLDTKDNDQNNNFYYNQGTVNQNTNRYAYFKKIAKPNEYWEGKRFELLVYLFGEDMAKWVKNAWDILPTLMYQDGFSRRSFRCTDFEDIHFMRQLNFIINLIHETCYDISFHEYAVYSNNIYSNNIPIVYAAAIDGGDKQIKSLCLDAIYGRHDIAKPSRCIIKAMLLSKDKECWEAVEKLLLSAQRQEGLRQTILECLDETSLGAMKHFIKIILDNKLTRFSSVVRAVDTWAGLAWEGEKETTVK